MKTRFPELVYLILLGLATLLGPKASGWFRSDGLIGQGDSATYEIVAKFEALHNRFPENWSDWFWPGSFWEPVQTVNYGLSPAALVKILIVWCGDAWTRHWILLQILLVLTSWFLVRSWLEEKMGKVTIAIFGTLFLTNPLILWSIFNVQKEILMLAFSVWIFHGIVLAIRSNMWNLTSLLFLISGLIGLFWLRGWSFVFAVLAPLSFWMAFQLLTNPKNKKFWLVSATTSAFFLVLIMSEAKKPNNYRFYEISYKGQDCTTQILEKEDYIINNNILEWRKKLYFEGSGNFSNDMVSFTKYLSTRNSLSKNPKNFQTNLGSEKKSYLKHAETEFFQKAQNQLQWKTSKMIPSIIDKAFLILTVKREGFLMTPGKTKIERPMPDNAFSALILVPLSLADGIFQPYPWLKWNDTRLSILGWLNGFLWLWLIFTFLWLLKFGICYQQKINAFSYFGPIFTICLLNLGLLGYVCLNVGALIRLRYPYWIILIGLLLALPNHLSQKKSQLG